MNKQIEAVIFDWAGTTVDYGCFGPVQVFVDAFKEKGIDISIKQAREPMGLEKREHIRQILNMKEVAEQWVSQYNREPNEGDVAKLYSIFEEKLLPSLKNFATPVPGLIETIDKLREMQLRIGSTTGYTRQMINIVAAEAKKQGYEPDVIVTADEVSKGRPFPWMCYKCAMFLEVFPQSNIVKVGDTLSDIQAGVNGGMWSVGIIKGGSDFGLSLEEVQTMDPQLLEERMATVRQAFFHAGADFVIEEVSELPAIIDKINLLLEHKEEAYG